MPLTTIAVGRVDASPTSKPGLTGYLITSAEFPLFQVHTLNQFAASLAQRAKDMGVPIDVLWKDGRYGKQLVDVTLHDRSVA